MGVVVGYPIIVHVDNVVDIFLSEKVSAYKRTNRIFQHTSVITEYSDSVTDGVTVF